ncbi:GNAT family N-acetyltransferase [Sphingomonas sp. PB2P12]|uniref:GNAT family N-acetyltransferase n=1 Tax=Sphingomonas sandaracina TaxID=3096157 RepID=UPI002FC6E4A0
MIETARLTLRAWRDDDAAAHHAMCADPAVMAYLGPAPSLADFSERVARKRKFPSRLDTRCFGAWQCQTRPVTPDWFRGLRHRILSTFNFAEPWMPEQVRHDGGKRLASSSQSEARSAPAVYGAGDGDFEHPKLAEDDRLRRHILYRIDRPAYV